MRLEEHVVQYDTWIVGLGSIAWVAYVEELCDFIVPFQWAAYRKNPDILFRADNYSEESNEPPPILNGMPAWPIP